MYLRWSRKRLFYLKYHYQSMLFLTTFNTRGCVFWSRRES